MHSICLSNNIMKTNDIVWWCEVAYDCKTTTFDNESLSDVTQVEVIY